MDAVNLLIVYFVIIGGGVMLASTLSYGCWLCVFLCALMPVFMDIRGRDETVLHNHKVIRCASEEGTYA